MSKIHDIETEVNSIIKRANVMKSIISGTELKVERRFNITILNGSNGVSRVVSSEATHEADELLLPALKELGVAEACVDEAMVEMVHSQLSYIIDEMEEDSQTEIIPGQRIRYCHPRLANPEKPRSRKVYDWATFNGDIRIIITALPETSEDRERAKQDREARVIRLMTERGFITADGELVYK